MWAILQFNTKRFLRECNNSQIISGRVSGQVQLQICNMVELFVLSDVMLMVMSQLRYECKVAAYMVNQQLTNMSTLV